MCRIVYTGCSYVKLGTDSVLRDYTPHLTSVVIGRVGHVRVAVAEHHGGARRRVVARPGAGGRGRRIARAREGGPGLHHRARECVGGGALAEECAGELLVVGAEDEADLERV